MTDIDVRPMGPHEFGVSVHEGDLTTHHRVTVPDQLLDDLGLPGLDEQALVEESFAYLLENEKATEIREEFALDDLRSTFPDYLPDMRDRLGTPG